MLPRSVAERLRLREQASPFRGMSQAEIDAALTAFGALHRRGFEAALRDLDSALLEADPVALLANLATYLMFRPEGDDVELAEAQPVLPFHLEFLQALALTHQRSDFPRFLWVRPDLLPRIAGGVQTVALSWALRDLNPVGLASGAERARSMAQAQIRLDTTAVRNWGFPDQMARIPAELFAPLDDAVEARIGLRPTALLAMFAGVVALVESRYNALMQRLARVLATVTTMPELVAAYFRAFPGMTGADALATLLNNRGATLDEARAMLLHHREAAYPDIYTLSIDDLAACYPGGPNLDALHGAAKAWSLGFGDLSGRALDRFFLDNPVRRQPLIALEDGRFFCPNASLLHSFGFRLVEGLLSDHEDLRTRYADRRARYLETRVAELFRRSFPSAQVHTGSKWRGQGARQEGENDLLVVLGDHAIVVEAKSGRVTDAALRGRSDRLEYTARKLVAEPASQAQRFAEFLRAAPGPHRLATEDGRTNHVDCSQVRRFVAVNATLELFGLLGLRWPILREADFLPADLEPVPTMSLADLEILTSVLQGEARLLHYLSRRAELEARPNLAGDELALLAHYLQTGFVAGVQWPADDHFVDLSLQAKLIDWIYPLPIADRPSDWPGTRLAPLWRQLVEDLEARQPAGWTTAALRLLDVPFKEQRRIARALEDGAGKARRASSSRTVKLKRLKSGPAGRKREVVVAAFKGYESDEAAACAGTLARAAGPGIGASLVVFVRVEDGGRAAIR